jgi:endonuclease G
MVPYGYPVPTNNVSQNTTPLCRIAYTVLHDNTRKVPLYSAELLLIENIPSKNKRVNAFKADPDLLPGKRAELSDYSELYDRGHMTPFEDARKNSAAALQTFYLSNMVPQDLHLNRGLWRALENKTRKWAQASSSGLYVITGPVFNGPKKVLGNGVGIPSHVFKVVIDRSTNQGIGFIIPNAGPAKGAKLESYQVTITNVERMTGLNFMPMAPYSNGVAIRDSMGPQFDLK